MSYYDRGLYGRVPIYTRTVNAYRQPDKSEDVYSQFVINSLTFLLQ